MRIISPFSDSYDTAAGWHDTSERPLIYHRLSKVVHEDSSGAPTPWVKSRYGPSYFRRAHTLKHTTRHLSYSESIPIDDAFLIFCGKAFKVFVEFTKNLTPEMMFWSSTDRYLQYANATYPRPGGTGEYALCEPHKSWFRAAEEKEYDAALADYMERDHSDINIKFGAPIVLILHPVYNKDRHASVIVNPKMGRNVDIVGGAFQAHQEIEMFLGSQLASEKDPPVKLADKEQVVKKGFDPKYGFRTRPHE